ncbi:2-C-methyl-D-erythritol 4-phosphate cytidylyltransferase [Geobacter argillaceus]|uniref:2-C-methyl-D-erythritol 4-phosphate cytidylyltransferase n=1 Tax=Geobacter argillaceus TaxID=345631 RepID=A0A562VLT1_9BACT|nr:2-C-methyl-D-erythritol 4-phosphate cytidylyltransferase [Geobacter argillaceus]TWJ18850.1 2-C-methyl-D-erythritol 4-phosphate cytidylyltransferase [Geobacter argillaceus]
MAVIALVPAAGMGKRMGAGINKQYLLLGGMPILARTLRLFEDAPFVDRIVPVIPADEIDFCREQVVERYDFRKIEEIVAGGKERQQSVLNGLRALEGCADDDIIVIHDGVRPFVPQHVVQRSIEVAREHDGALVAVPVKDTVKVVEAGIVMATPPRETLWLAQTPQTFRYGVIRAAHEIADAEQFLGTDDASLVERLNDKVQIVIGDYRNIKITTPEDLVLAEAFLAAAKSESER